jgi:hypothetical protein
MDTDMTTGTEVVICIRIRGIHIRVPGGFSVPVSITTYWGRDTWSDACGAVTGAAFKLEPLPHITHQQNRQNRGSLGEISQGL